MIIASLCNGRKVEEVNSIYSNLLKLKIRTIVLFILASFLVKTKGR